jgi:hypothetical protein
MNRRLTFLFLLGIFVLTALPLSAQSRRKARPWPDINLSTVPSVMWMANSWPFEINHRSPAYLGDLDKMYISLAFGYGKNSNTLNRLANGSEALYGYRFYRDIDYKNTDFRLSIYSNFGKTTFGSLWVVYGRDRNVVNKEPFLAAVPSRLDFRTALAWKPKPNLTIGVSGSLNNYPASYVFALQPVYSSPGEPSDSQLALPAGDGENMSGEVDLLYRTKNNLDVIVGGIFQRLHEKFELPDPPPDANGLPANFKDTSIVKEYIYSGAPKLSVKKTFASGSYLRGGFSYYFNLFDYQYQGSYPFDALNQNYPSYRGQSFENLVPKWKLYADGTRVVGANSAIYGCIETGQYPNALSHTDTDFAPLQASFVDLQDISSTSLNVELTSRLTRIFHGMVGFEARYFSTGSDKTLLDNRSIYLSARLGGTTRFYRNLWWTIRMPDIRLYTSKSLGSAILFENKSYIETDILFLGL